MQLDICQVEQISFPSLCLYTSIVIKSDIESRNSPQTQNTTFKTRLRIFDIRDYKIIQIVRAF